MFSSLVYNNLNIHIKLTYETEQNKKFPFLDVLVHRAHDNSIFTTVYRKLTYTDRYLNSKSHHPTCRKASVVKTLNPEPFLMAVTKHFQTQKSNIYTHST